MIPDTLVGWTLDVVRALVEQGVFESDRFDFKVALPHKQDEQGKSRVRKACAAFANSDGGFLVVGVKDDKGLDPTARMVGIDPAEDFPEKFGNYPATVQPCVEWTFKNPALRLGSGMLVHVVHIPASRRKPHAVLEADRWCFCKRTPKGTELMSYEEIRGAFVDVVRLRTSLGLLRSEVERIGRVAEELRAQLDGATCYSPDWRLVRYDAALLKEPIPILFEILQAHDGLLTGLNLLRQECDEADRAMERENPKAMPTVDAMSRSQFAAQFIRQILPAANHVLGLLSKVSL